MNTTEDYVWIGSKEKWQRLPTALIKALDKQQETE